MKVEWDRAKAARNQLKHRVEFADAALVLEDEHGLTIEDSSASGEARFISVGMDGQGRILVVVYTYQNQSFKLISARKASRAERRAYEKELRF